MSSSFPCLATLCAVALAGCSQSDQPNPNKVPPAARMFEKNVLQPPPQKAPTAPAAATPEPPKVEAKVEPPKVEAAKPAPPKAEPPKPAPPKAAAPRAEPTPPRTDVAAAKPSAAPAPAAPVTRLVSRVDPDFPREALQAGVDKGTVKARMTLDETGSVTRVEVMEANPRRVFDRAVVRALAQWRYNEGAAGRTVEAEVDFKR